MINKNTEKKRPRMSFKNNFANTERKTKRIKDTDFLAAS